MPVPPAPTWKDLPTDVRTQYALTDSIGHWRLHRELWARIEAEGLERVYALDMRVLPFLVRNEEVGLACDTVELNRLSRVFQADLDATLADITTLAGRDINPNAAKQVSDLLFEELGVRPTRMNKSKTAYTTQDKYLKARRSEHGIIQLILNARQLRKYISTYTSKLPSLLQDGRYYPNWKYTRTATGRLAEEVILLIPKHDPLAKVQNRENRAKAIRNCFHATDGHELVSVDLSQIELRVMAHLSRDPKMLAAYASGQDLHAQTAHELLGAPKRKADQDESAHRLPAKCFHPDTEVLTKSGWTRIIDLQVNQEIIQAHPGPNGHVRLSWTIPLEIFTTHHPSQQLVHLKNEGIDLRVTPDHRMLGWRTNGEWFVTTPVKLNTSARYWANAGMLGNGHDGCHETDSILYRLAVAAQADGSITIDGAVRFGFTRPRKIARLAYLLGRAHVPYTRSKYANGVTAFYIKKSDATQILQYLDPDKTLPWRWLQLRAPLRRAILNEAKYWDGCQMKHWRAYRYDSVVAKNRNVLQAIAAVTGLKTRQHKHSLSVRDHATSRAGSACVTTHEYTDLVACLSVPSTFVLVRDGGVPVICGQTVNFGIINGMTEYGMLDQLHEAGQLQWDLEQVQEMLRGWFDVYAGVAAYWDEQKAKARKIGYVESMYGRRRYLAGIHSTDERIVREAERQCLFAIQSSADEISKAWNARLWNRVILPRQAQGQYCEPWVRVHDDTTLECESRHATAVAQAMLRLIPQPLDIPSPGEAKRGTQWGDLK